jgi:SanA protein
MKKRKYLTASVLLLTLITSLTFYANEAIENASKDFITSNLDEVKPTKVGLLLGTSRILKNGIKNDFFFNRIDATVELYKNGKIKFIIVSGDNSKDNYNEPLDMKKELIKNGIPDSVIFLDYAGLRTLDSVIRAKEIFGQTTFIIISQKSHNERGVFIARKNNIIAYAYNAKEVNAYKGFKTKIREYFARDKVYLDLLFGVTPKFLGTKIEIK